MKTVRSIKIVGSLVIVIAALTGFAGCEGPQGPEGPIGVIGPSGPQGNPGINPSDQCGTCHNISSSILAKQMEYQDSKHFQGGNFTRATNATCASCHSNEGFGLSIAGQQVTGISNPTPVNCRTCHNIHTTYTAKDYDLSTDSPVLLSGIMFNNQVVDIGKGNLCARCHQTRPQNYGLEVGGPDITIGSAHWGPHYGAQANILAGKSGFEVAGTLNYTNSAHTTLIDDGCVTCHMGSHDFKPKIESCRVCHSNASSFDINSVQTEIQGLLYALQDSLISAGILGSNYRPVANKTLTSAQAGALLNYMMVKYDGSLGVHNKNYTKALLQNSLEVFAP